MCVWILIAVSYFLSSCEVLTLSPKPYEGDTGMKYSVHGTSLVINCNKEDNTKIRTAEAFPPPNATFTFNSVTIIQCLPERYFDEFKALNINTTSIDSLHLENMKNENISFNTPNSFEPLSNLKSLHIKGIAIPLLPNTMRLINLTLTDESSIMEWGNCGHLKRLHLSGFTKKDFPKWPQNCTRLEYLEIERLLPETALHVAERMIPAASSLKTLRIHHCRLYNLPIEMIRSATNLVHLDLSDNVLYDNLFWMFPSHKTLKTLDLSRNLIRGESSVGGLATKLPALKELLLRDEIGVYNVCSGSTSSIQYALIIPLQNTSIEYLDFGETYTYMDCFGDTRFLNLQRITLLQATTNLGLELLRLPQTDAGHIEIDLGPSTITEILFNETDYETLRRENSTSPYNGRNLTLLMKHIKCDCNHGWLARALRDFPHIISIPGLRCNDKNGNLILKELDRLECNMTWGDGCYYRQSWSDERVTGECSNWTWTHNITKFSYPLYGMNVSGEGIVTLDTELPNTLQWLDLRRNLISRGNAEQAAALFAGGRRVWLADNLLLCDCENRALLDAIQQHQQQVQDYDLLKCVGTGEALSSVSTDVLCQVALTVSLSVFGALIMVAGLIALLLRRYGEQLRIFLYSRGWCMSCLQRHDPDDKPYDAFISFAHEDREYVMGTLLPGLENAPERFRICVHYRDWLVGDWIPAQIMRSVQLSKRTLIILSRNFVASAWSTLEFRYSITNADEDPHANVLVLIKDDVLDMNLDMELRGYLTYNTYLSCDDPWFWEKLRYAMPHRVKSKTSGHRDFVTEERGQEMHMWPPNVAIAYPNSTESTQENLALHLEA